MVKIPIACTLSGEAAVDRLAEWRRVLAASVVAIDRPSPGRVEMQLSRDPLQIGAVVDLACREKACCEFFEFALEIGAERATLVVSVPPGAVPVLDEFAGLVRPL